ncbi:hypothetical protein NDU88_001302 [Pleurodeles waltl]|uniref:RNase H type-1 domain-containing protein n=1 Tax=Pleurodeles waltl TaxID=8319 RepID=A0AAV7USE6_PLEWA|nr:hypothetical protein NDU88_001302 [Pleurodeles waltl]
MHIPQAPMEKQQVMLTQQVTGQRPDNSNNTVHQFPFHSGDEINDEWMIDSSDEGTCILAASLEVHQRGPFVKGKVIGHKVSFLVDNGATRSAVRSVEVPNLPLSSRTVQVLGVENRQLTNPITEPVQVELGNYLGLHRFVVCDSSPVSLLGRDLLCKTKCSINCTDAGIEVQTNSDDEEEQASAMVFNNAYEEYPLIEMFPLFTIKELHADLQGIIKEKVWDLTGKEVGLIKGVEPIKITLKPNVEFPKLPQYNMAQDVMMKVAQIIGDFLKQGVLKEVLSSPCNSPIMGLKKPCGKVWVVQDLRKVNDMVVKCCPIVPNPAVILFQIPCEDEKTHLTGARLTRYETSILGAPNVTLKICTVLNPATLLPSDTVEIEKEEDIEHDCLEVTELCTKPRPDIRDTRLEENDQIVFVDGSCLRDGTGTLRAGYAVCTITGSLEASCLPGVYSARVAELVALTRACYVSTRLQVTIYTDSQYGFGIVHDLGQLWSQRGFMTSSGTPVRNGDRIKELLYAIQMPEEIAVVKCSAHQKTQDYISLGNGYADQVARFCALNCISFKDKWELMPEEETSCASFALKIINTLEELKTLQENADKEEKKLLAKLKCVQRPDEIWVSDEGQMVLPNCLLTQMARYYNGQAHIGRDAMIRLFKVDWFNPKFRQAAEAMCHRCGESEPHWKSMCTIQQNAIGFH